MNTAPPFPSGTPVVAYLRDSGGSEQDLSVDQQREVIQKWCLEHGYSLSKVFADVATPGSTVVGREAFQRLIQHFHNPDHAENVVVLWKYSRFSRDLDDAAFYKADLRRRGVSIHSINDNIPDTTDGRLFENLIDWMNARFLEDLSSDVKRGLHHLLENYGALPGTPPRGFKREPVQIGTRRDGSAHTACRWVPDPDLWETCKIAWRMRASGENIRRIHAETHLFANRSSYNTFFRNRLYLGELNYGGQVIPGYTEALVDQNTWDLVQKLNRENSDENHPLRSARHPRRVTSSYLLSGLAYCLKCGALLSGKTVTFQGKVKMAYYHCSNAAARMSCDARRIPAPALERILENSLMEYILEPMAILERNRQLAASEVDTRKALADQRTHLNGKLNDTRKRIRTVVERITADENSPRALISALKELEAAESELVAQLAGNKLRAESMAAGVKTMVEAEELVKVFRERWRAADLEGRRTILRLLIRKVTCERDGKTVFGMVHFYNPTPEQIKQKLPPDEGESLPTCRCLHGDAFHWQTWIINYSARIKYNRIIKLHLQPLKKPTGSP
jgi:DNA invertase Pin-like site-specific DNA recombinase